MRRAQSGLEFMITYGWAILVLVVVISTISYLVINKPSKVVPDQCVMGAGMSFIDCKTSTGGFEFILQNNLGSTIRNVVVSINTSGDSEIQCDESDASQDILRTSEKSMPFKLCVDELALAESGLRFDAEVTVFYVKTGDSFEQKIFGFVKSNIKG